MLTRQNIRMRLLALLMLSVFVVPDFALAADGSGSWRIAALRVFQIVWAVVGAGALGLMVFGFVRLRKSHTSDDLLMAASAKRLIIIGAISLGVVVVIFIVLAVIYGTLAARESTFFGNEKEPETISTSSLGGMIGHYSKVKQHYPGRDEKNIPRNSAILVYFSESLKPESLYSEDKKVLRSAVTVQKTGSKDASDLAPLLGELSSDGMVLKLIPEGLLGEANKKTSFTVSLLAGMRKVNGDSLFGNTGGYTWQFEVNGIVDNTPPTVESVMPLPQDKKTDASGIPINHLIQITFSKAIDPSAITQGKIEVLDVAKKAALPGGFQIGNNFKSVTFIPKELCETKNICGEATYCLPKDAGLKIVIHAATLREPRTKETPNKAKSPYDGVVDASGNSLDGGGENGKGKNTRSDGAGLDDFFWSFATSSRQEVDPPKVVKIQPGRDVTRVDPRTPVIIDFSTLMDASSLYPGSLVLGQDVNFSVAPSHDMIGKKTSVRIDHEPFAKDKLYSPEVQAEVHDIYQNCFNPCTGPLPQ